MAVKTFTSGETLTASDTNTYLANAGLDYIKSQTIGNNVSSVSVTGVFSSTYDNYRIVVNGGTSNGAQAIAMQLGPSSVTGYNTSYYNSLFYLVYATNATNSTTTNNGSTFQYVGEANPSFLAIAIDVLNPNLAKNTIISGNYTGQDVAGFTGGRHNGTGQFTDFTLSVGGTMTGGTITVYGYRKA